MQRETLDAVRKKRLGPEQEDEEFETVPMILSQHGERVVFVSGGSKGDGQVHLEKILRVRVARLIVVQSLSRAVGEDPPAHPAFRPIVGTA